MKIKRAGSYAVQGISAADSKKTDNKMMKNNIKLFNKICKKCVIDKF